MGPVLLSTFLSPTTWAYVASVTLTQAAQTRPGLYAAPTSWLKDVLSIFPELPKLRDPNGGSANAREHDKDERQVKVVVATT